MAFSPKTGKMHQIRKHAQELKCPIAGDRKYCFDRSFKNLMLHSCIIAVPQDIKAQTHRFRASLPLHWKQFLCEPQDL
jgi:23S rRNA-/tRNA-specific pseudouridylate synthase